MAGMIARDAVVRPGAVASANVTAGTLQRVPRGNVCVVFQDGRHTRSACAGILSSEQVNENPDALLARLLGPAPPTGIPDTQPVVEVLKRLRSSEQEYLPVFDHRGDFAGVISQASIMEALLRRERQLLRKTREFRQTSHDDKERRYETTRRLEQTNLAFRKLLTSLSRPENLETFRHALEALTVVADAGWAQLALCDENGAITQRLLGSHPSAETYPPNYLAEQHMQQVIAGNKLLNLPGSPAAADNDSAESAARRKHQPAFLGLPLSLDDRRFGCVYLWDKLGTRAFMDDDEVLLSSLGHAISITIAQAIDHRRRRRLEKELDLVARIAREVGGAESLEGVARIVRDRTEDYWDWDAFAVCISRCHGRKFQAVLELDKAAVGTPPGGDTWSEVYDTNEPTADGEASSSSPQVNRRIMSGEPILINRTDLSGVELMRPFGDRERPSASLMYVPIHGRGRAVGLITVQSYQKNRYKSSDLAFFQRLADAVAPAFCRCLAERTTRAFYDLASKLSTASTPKESARIITEVADDLIGWDSCSMYFYHPENDTHTNVLLVDHINGRRMELDAEEVTAKPGGLSRRALSEGPILYLRPEARFDSAQNSPFGDKTRPSASLMYVPLQYKDRTLGVLSVQSYEINAYDQDDLDLLKALADQCSGAIDRIREQ